MLLFALQSCRRCHRSCRRRHCPFRRPPPSPTFVAVTITLFVAIAIFLFIVGWAVSQPVSQHAMI
jgi:hypothetical protein